VAASTGETGETTDQADGPDAGRPAATGPPARTEQDKARRPHSMLRETGGIVLTALIVSLLVKTFLVQAFYVPSGSMEPTLHGCPGCRDDRIMVSKLTTHLGGIHRGDVVVFHDRFGWLPEQPAATAGVRGHLHSFLTYIGLAPASADNDLVKRVIAVGGDTVVGRDGAVYVDGAKLTEPYVAEGSSPAREPFRVTVPKGSLWVMGDNRDASADSRAHRNGPGHGFVRVDDVVGRAFAVVWPLDRATILHRPPTFDQPALQHHG
jgi:signal peptidase I